MTHHDDLDRTLVSWFADDAGRRAPDGLLDAIVTGSRTRRQRPAWVVTLRGESMGGVALFRNAGSRRMALLIVLAALVALAVGLAVIGQHRPSPVRTGLLAFVRNGDVYLANADGSGSQVALHQDGVAFATVAWSPGGSRLAIGGDSGAIVLDVRTGEAKFVGGGDPVWSPDGRELAVLDAGGGELRIVETATMSTRDVYPFAAVGGLAWSPNGRWIAATGAKDVVRIDVTTGDVVELDRASGHLDSAKDVSWSPDSRRIAFIRYVGGNSPPCSDTLRCRIDVIVADADGSHAIRVNQVPGSADLPSWSPDGAWFAFREIDWARRGPLGIRIVRPDGTGERSIVTGAVMAYAWSPEGDRLHFTLWEGPGPARTLWEASLNGNTQALGVSIDAAPFEGTGLRAAWQFVTREGSLPSVPGLAPPAPAATLEIVTPAPAGPADPSGTWPTLASASSDGCKPVMLRTDAGVATTIADLCGSDRAVETASWSPTGSAYAAIRDGRLLLAYPDGRVDSTFSTPQGFASVGWSPDGTWLSLATGQYTQAYILRTDGSQLRALSGSPSWSPDSRTIAVANADGTLLVGGPDRTDLRAIGSFPMPTAWSPGGSRFAFLRDGNLWTATRDGTDLRNVTSFALGGATGAAWSADGQWIAVTLSHGLWVMRPDGSDRRWLGFGLDTFSYGVAWSPDSSRLALATYTDAPSGQQIQRVYLVNADGTPTIEIDSAFAPSWSPDGRFLVVSDAEASAGGGFESGNLAVMNADGSGRHDLQTAGFDWTLVWVR